VPARLTEPSQRLVRRNSLDFNLHWQFGMFALLLLQGVLLCVCSRFAVF
jgi:hypothetical protein